MKTPPLPPNVPRAAQETVRKAMIALLRENSVTAQEISGAIGIPEKEVYRHLEHIRRSLRGSGVVLEVTPARCRKCRFVFAGRERLTSPTKCPVCRHEAISEPLFAVREREG